MKIITIAAVAALVVWALRAAASNTQPDPADPNNWDYMPGYVPGSGTYL